MSDLLHIKVRDGQLKVKDGVKEHWLRLLFHKELHILISVILQMREDILSYRHTSRTKGRIH
jgi:hypothetical protein